MLIGIVAMVLFLGVAAVGGVGRRRRRLRKSPGPGYETAARESDGACEADRKPPHRKRVHERMSLHPISVADQDYYSTAWVHLHGVFLDDPGLALRCAGQMVSQLIEARGYPSGEPGERIALLSVEHAAVRAGYRRAQWVSEHTRDQPAPVPTEEARQALLSYYTLFNHLMAVPGALAVR